MSNAAYIRSGLLRRGLPQHVADAFMVNFRDESGLDPGINEAKPLVPGSRGGFGLYQLTGSRRRGYEAFAASRKVNPSDIDAQLDFLGGELGLSGLGLESQPWFGSESSAARSILGAGDTASAAQAIVKNFLRPAAQHRNRRVANYAGLGDGSSGAGQPSPLQSAMADRENVASSTNESTGMAESKPTVHIGLKPERSTALFDAMLAKAMSNGAQSANVGEAISNLSQVWAATRGKSKAEAENASELQKALAASGLDPSYAMAAQLGGDRSSVASAILAQEDNRTQAANRAEQRADRLDEREYQREQDVLANARADQTLALQTAKANAPPDQPSSVREYEYARQNGYTGTYQDWETQSRKAGATVVNMPGQPNIGTIPQGYEAVQNPETQAWSMRRIPGGPEDDTKANAKIADNRAVSTDIITTAADRARDALGADGLPATGTMGRMLSAVPESNASELRRQVAVLQANAKVENLTAMRAASPTGAALGAVSDSENAMLAAKSGSLDPDSPTFARDLDDYERTMLRIVHGAKAGDAIFEQKQAERSRTNGAQPAPAGAPSVDYRARYGLE